jgi:hypothetical protein
MDVAMLVAENEAVIRSLQGHLDEMWALIDRGEEQRVVLGWLRKGGHKSISDWQSTEVADLIEAGRRSASMVSS